MHPPEPGKARERLIVALDVSTEEQADDLVSKLEGSVSFFKVGMELQLVAGIRFVRKLTNAGKKVFLDGKWWDVPETVRRVVRLAGERRGILIRGIAEIALSAEGLPLSVPRGRAWAIPGGL